jgi:predicted metalloprotease
LRLIRGEPGETGFCGAFEKHERRSGKSRDISRLRFRLRQRIGDDTLQKRTQGYVVPDAFTHGSAEQRKRWFATGLKTGDIGSCDTFTKTSL